MLRQVCLYAAGVTLIPTSKGRDEHPDNPQDWVRYHDKYKH
jgi:hypothetical protein